MINVVSSCFAIFIIFLLSRPELVQNINNVITEYLTYFYSQLMIIPSPLFAPVKQYQLYWNWI